MQTPANQKPTGGVDNFIPLGELSTHEDIGARPRVVEVVVM